ncbi:dUTP diphosphatase [Tepidibacillus fermentans]|uniref:Deoxyuridine 5'-triphosphate nucleotidohydrolase n=1 Tax=Tepidibacillus fermentans TaxID=1281767 RepID=A0A4R3KII9_9BACI|nr:dUTP diphosphatase [Tepidibacillus fermentans]TCS82994.1 dUTP pyrophosphatase [Tepidibacillus fermentans]
MYPIKIKRLPGYDHAKIPQRMSEGASGFDIFAAINEPIRLRAGERRLIPTGFAIEMPIGVEAQIRPRSGLALKHGISILNTPGTIDADYRGEVGVIIINLGQEDFEIKPGDRIAQLVFVEVPKVTLEEVEELSDSTRGTGGFGHTGR